MNLSARAYNRVLKLARTIADLAGSERTGQAHIAMPILDRPRSSIGRDGRSNTKPPRVHCRSETSNHVA